AVCFLARLWNKDDEKKRLNAEVYVTCAIAGVLFGLAAWLRQNTMLLAPFVVFSLVWIARRARDFRLRQLIPGAVIVIASILMIALITIRNYVLFHEFVPVGINFGIVLWEGIGESDGGDRFGAVVTDGAVSEQEVIWYNNPHYGWWSTPD